MNHKLSFFINSIIDQLNSKELEFKEVEIMHILCYDEDLNKWIIDVVEIVDVGVIFFMGKGFGENCVNKLKDLDEPFRKIGINIYKEAEELAKEYVSEHIKLIIDKLNNVNFK